MKSNGSSGAGLDCAGWDSLLESLHASAGQVRLGGGQRNINRQHAKGRLTARERIRLLIDEDSELFEIGLFAAFGRFEEFGGAPSAGLVTGIGAIEKRPCMIVANDATVKAGAFFPTTTKKLLRAQRIAGENRLPLIYLVDSAGVFLPLQDEIFPDRDDFGRIFYNNARLSAAGVPQIAAIMGSCVAGGAYLPVMCDKILMTEGSGLYIAGPALVKAAIGQKIESDELGGARVHAQLSGTVDFREADDEACLRRLRLLVDSIGIPYSPVFHDLQVTEVSAGFLEELPLQEEEHWSARSLLAAIGGEGEIEEEVEVEGALCVRIQLGRRQAAVAITGAGRSRVGPSTIGRVLEFVKRSDSDAIPSLVVDCGGSWDSGCREAAELSHYLATSGGPRLLLLAAGHWEPGWRLPFGKGLQPRLVLAWPNVRARGWTAADADADIRHAEARLGVDRIIDPASTALEVGRALGLVGE